jgi:hypothetical protein
MSTPLHISLRLPVGDRNGTSPASRGDSFNASPISSTGREDICQSKPSAVFLRPLDADHLRLADEIAFFLDRSDRLAHGLLGGRMGDEDDRLMVGLARCCLGRCTIDSSEIWFSAMRVATLAKTPVRSRTVRRMK